MSIENVSAVTDCDPCGSAHGLWENSIKIFSQLERYDSIKEILFGFLGDVKKLNRMAFYGSSAYLDNAGRQLVDSQTTNLD